MKSTGPISIAIPAIFLCIVFSYTGCKKDDPLPISEIPVITGVSPDEGTIGTEMTITGSNFKAGAIVTLGDKAMGSVEISSGSVIYARVPSGIPANTLLSVKVKNPGGGEAISANVFKAVDPVLSFVNSATKPSGNANSTVILEGKAFGDGQGAGEVLFSDGQGGTIVAVIADSADWTDSFIVTTLPVGTKDGPVIVKTEIGVSNEIPFKVTDAATFSPSAINWTETTPLPLAVSGHRSVAIAIEETENSLNRFVFVTGGRDGEGEATDQVVGGLISADGTIDSWVSSTDLPAPRSFHAFVAATPFNSRVEGSGYLFLLGGTNSDGEAISDVSVAALNSDGTLQAWQNSRPLPEALHSAGAVIFRSTIYVAGGATGENMPVSTVYRAGIREDGQLGEWEELPGLPTALAYHGFVSFGGYLYTVGGETGIAAPDAGNQVTGTKQIFYSRINLRTGDIDSWTENPAGTGKERSKHSALVLGGNLFISSGLYSGAPGSSENAYANINSDGTVGNFGGATGSNTLLSKGGSNLFNQSGISYIDSEGVAHVMILGGARVGSPALKLNKVLFY